jgi:L-rhamnose-H+ transport protein
MVANPFLGVVFHWLGGLASGSFYVPYKAVKKWAWEIYWLVGGFFSWIIAPWILALVMVPHLAQVLHETPMRVLFWAYFWGAMWGGGGLTFGLTMRYLGMSLGMAVALGFCAAFGTLMPPIFDGTLVSKLHEHSGFIIMVGVVVCLLGIAIAGIAGMSKEKEMPDEEKKKAVKEFNFGKGILVATFSGIMSASFAYGLNAAEPIAVNAARYGTSQIWTGLPKLVIVLLGGFTTNFIWCVLLNLKNKTGYQYLDGKMRPPVPSREDEPIIETATDAPAEEMAIHSPKSASVVLDCDRTTDRAPMLNNYFFSALAGVTWYMQFFFYTMGETQMGQYKFSSWTLHMASIIIFSSLWGIALKEWKGTSIRTKSLLTFGLAVLIGSTVIVGYGNYLATLK